ncbi:MAG: methyltransferase domain-containing protein [Oleispira sp.]
MARQAFLNSDFYRPISDSLNQIIVDSALKISALKLEQPIQVLDIGCGEGYYSQRMHNSLSDHQIEHNLFGLDISKDAVIAAAKRAKAETLKEDVPNTNTSEWLVASAIDIPLQAQSIDIATCLFTRLMPESYHKVIKQGGFFICVNTGEKHLIELREKLYEEITKAEFDPVKNMGEDFELVDHQQVSYQNTLSSQQQIQDLLLMTPHNWRTKADKKEALASLEELTVTIDAQIHIFKAKEKAIVEVEVVEEVIETVSSSNPWGKAKVAAEPEALVEAVSETVIESTTVENAEPTSETPVEMEAKPKASSSASPWGKATVETEVESAALPEVATEAVIEKPTEEVKAESNEKANPWAKG